MYYSGGIYDKSYNTLKHILMSDKKLSGNDLLTDYVILKGLYDSYYCDEYPKEYLIAVTDSLMLNSKHKQVKEIAQSLSQKFTKLMVGYPAPQFSLKDQNGNEHGEFWQTPLRHLSGDKCPKCFRSYKKR